MSRIPVFEIGLWNAWILSVLMLLPLPFVVFVRKGVFKKTASIHASVLTDRESKIFIFSKIFMLSAFIYSIFLPLKVGTVWFSIGLPELAKK
jgi:hypothetical protein